MMVITHQERDLRRDDKIRTKPYGSAYLGTLPYGCRQCVLGKKLVLFVTGRCARSCYYCPLGPSRKDVDSSFANERPAKSVADVISEARMMRAQGCGVTGGDPMERLGRTVKFVKALKEEFGNSFHVHLYTNGALATIPHLKRLRSAGVDEIRFHFSEKGVRNALKVGGWSVGAEVPAIPGELERLKKHIMALDRLGAQFINLNELDFSETNAVLLSRQGFSLSSQFGSAVAGSRETALKLLDWARNNTQCISVHFCASRVKGGIQLRRRLLRTARNVRKPYESISRDGLLVRGELWVADGKKIMTSVEAAKRTAGTRKKGVKAFIVTTYPSWDALEVERIPLV